MDDTKLAAIVDAIVRELQASGAVRTNGADSAASAPVSPSLSAPSAVPIKPRQATSSANLSIDLPDPVTDDQRYNAWCCARLMDEFSDDPDDSHLFPAPRPQFIQVGEYMVVDICMRMLEPRELYNANGFPRSYIIDQDIDGTRWPKSEQVARCGNSVPPPFAEALVRANMPQYCVWRIAA